MKRNASVGVVYLSVFVGFSLLYWLCWNFPQKKNKQKEIKTELKVYSVSSDTTYICKTKDLIKIIEKDNE